MIENIVRDYTYLMSALGAVIEPVVTGMRALAPNEYIEIDNVTVQMNRTVRFTATVRGQSDGPELPFSIPVVIVEAAMAKLKVEDSPDAA